MKRHLILSAKILYALLKCIPTDRSKIVFLSRQSRTLPLDFHLLIEEITRQRPDVTVNVLCWPMGENDWYTGKSLWVLTRSLYHLATARVAILDAHWPTISVLRHKKSLKVIQIWHALGKIKRSGRHTVGMLGGRTSQLAELARMHEGYDLIIAGAEAWNPAYCASFGVKEDVLVNIGLPRADYLLNQKASLARAITERYPALAEKPVIIYAPTFRRWSEARYQELVESIDLHRFTLVIKGHPIQRLSVSGPHVYECPEFSSLQMLAVADYLITDYSAIALEAAVIDVKTLYFLYDYDQYVEDNGLNIDLFSEMPGCAFRTATEVVEALERSYPAERLQAYKDKWVFKGIGNSTSDLVNVIFEEGKLCARG